MQINNNNNAVSFESRASIKRMLKLPETSAVTKDINKFTGSIVDDIYLNRKNLGEVSFIQNNSTTLEKTKKELGKNLILDSETEEAIKDETFKISLDDFIKFFDVVSENPKKPLSKLIGKIDKIPSLSSLLDSVKMLNFPMANTSFGNIFLMVSGIQPERKAVLTPLRKAFENTNESLNDIISEPKKELANSLKENVGYLSYKALKEKAFSFIQQSKDSKEKPDLEKLSTQFQGIIEELQKLSQ